MSWFSLKENTASQSPVKRVPGHLCLESEVVHLLGPGTLGVANGRLLFRGSKVAAVALAAKKLEYVMVHGPVRLTSASLSWASRFRVPILYFDHRGQRLLGRVDPVSVRYPFSRLVQYHVASDPKWSTRQGRQIVLSKLHSISALVRANGGKADDDLMLRLEQIRTEIEDSTTTIDQLRGYEGTASALWFKKFGTLLPKGWKFPRRARRPPPDPINSLLSFGYTLLVQRVENRLRAVHLEPCLGTLHAFRAGRPSLACDLMEPIRVPSVDKWILALLRQKQIKPDDFQKTHRQGCRMKPSVLPKVLGAWHLHWDDHQLDVVLDQSVLAYRNQLQENSEIVSSLKRRFLGVKSSRRRG